MATSEKFKRNILRIIPAIAIAAALSACTTPNSSKNAQRTPHSEPRMLNGSSDSLAMASQDEFEQLVQSVDTKSKIMDQYANWKGVSYRLGGTTKSGIDCSSFVQRTFIEQFGVALPRTTSEQESSGQSVKRNNLKAGDLVLFKTGRRMKHVGIYIGDNKFVHASTSSGVIVSEMTNEYWSKRYYAGRRVINGS
ncbi:bifunctional murein DD-endopeptidase/murein LD-carboxypeptidase [Providencia vermicola]|uniref:Bifunctional murein DD-endopeptidase/murein LD-carboxypeptidase n=2 Tax=Providencia TaxID=586 RepID=A0AAI9MTR4_PROST|nr:MULTISPECIES: bifunctional murein DD-endopeptidase/murein LD-carboxypeptidase [Providencia]ELR5046431.1 bifunctional murein DD-endopeptidase/murein LD-carboxypeptidase [Providencia rettgeri]ELR5034013.1 bifunctional murein DD-endopeptidase/murein LD-carboxypeptidase [Providencia stuartii]ELR5119621.1 bifunctional murein DD-endopeptidase/murein LD-carboxypeptidase [Providencia stuartii]ELR5141365.1 bifunctional murein DD-endopeptidase/murein LD-carboxypeptidase [Providencia stuartii]ELR52907